MNLYILDIDGTLMPSHVVDNECYWRAVETVFDRDIGIPALDGFTNVTDTGILGQWARDELGRELLADELDRVQRAFLALLQRAAFERPTEFRPTAGVEDWLQLTSMRSDCGLAIATGGWGLTARFKLQVSGLARFDMPLACSDDAVSRTGIMRHAQQLMAAGTGDVERVTYIGDGPWDASSAYELGWDFIGIASGERARELADAGARQVLADFTLLARS